MKRNGPPNGGGPGAERKLRAVGEPPHIRSDAGRASSPSATVRGARSTAPMSPAAAPTRVVIVLKPQGRGRFDAFFQEARIVNGSAQPICDAARALHRLGHPDDCMLLARHDDGADHDAIRGPLGVWRTLRVREGRGPPRFVRWEPFPSRRVNGKEREIIVRRAGGSRHEFGAPSTLPGAKTAIRPMAAVSDRSRRCR
jgi:hypothetical protein